MDVGLLHKSTPLSSAELQDSGTARSFYALSPVFKVARPPVATIIGSPAVNAGEVASFTINVSPAPTSDLPINLLVGRNGFVAPHRQGVQFGAVTIGAGQTSADFSVPTRRGFNYWGELPVRVWLLNGEGYHVGMTDHGAHVTVIGDPAAVRPRVRPPVVKPPVVKPPVEPPVDPEPPVVEPPVVEPPVDPPVDPPVEPPVVEEDAPVMSFARSSSTVSESAGLINVIIDVSPWPEVATTFSYTVGGSAEGGHDYRSLSGTLILPPFTTGFTIPILITDDRSPEADETVILKLNDAEGYGISGTVTHTLTIIDND